MHRLLENKMRQIVDDLSLMELQLDLTALNNSIKDDFPDGICLYLTNKKDWIYTTVKIALNPITLKAIKLVRIQDVIGEEIVDSFDDIRIKMEKLNKDLAKIDENFGLIRFQLKMILDLINNDFE